MDSGGSGGGGGGGGVGGPGRGCSFPRQVRAPPGSGLREGRGARHRHPSRLGRAAGRTSSAVAAPFLLLGGGHSLALGLARRSAGCGRSWPKGAARSPPDP